jgi:hypothetical protein
MSSLDSPHQHQFPHMYSSPWVHIFAELCNYDPKLTTHLHTTPHIDRTSPHITTTTVFFILNWRDCVPKHSLMTSVCFCYPPPHLCIIIAGFIEYNNGRTHNSHPDGCTKHELACTWETRQQSWDGAPCSDDGSWGIGMFCHGRWWQR